MIRIALPLIALSLMGCASNPDYLLPGEQAPLPTPCGMEKLGGFVGYKRSAPISEQVAKVSGAKSIRWIKPGMAVTMDYREDRLNARLDEKGVILSFNCG